MVALGTTVGQGSDPVAEPATPSDVATEAPRAEPTRWQVTARPGVPAGPASPLEPTSIRLPSGTELDVSTATTDAGGELVVPDDIERAGWWDGGARVGDPFGTMVIAAHVDSRIQGLGPFAELLSATEGDAVQAHARDVEQTYLVTTATRIARTDLPERDDLFTSSGPHRLVLLTCAGDFVPELGGYQELAVVVAEPSDGPR